MGHRIPQVDAYIEAAAPFARPILKAVREAYHEAHRASLVSYVRDAVRINEDGVKRSRPPKNASAAVEVPSDLVTALEANATAQSFRLTPEASRHVAGGRRQAPTG